MEGGKRTPKAVIVGGSIAGLSCAHALIGAGWEVTVIEKTKTAPSGSPTGAGLSLWPQSMEIVDRWLGDPTILRDISFPGSSVLHQTYDHEKKTLRVLGRDEYDSIVTCRTVHWTDLYSIIHRPLPPGIVLWGHQFLSFCTSDHSASVRIEVKVIKTNEIVEIEGDLLIAADGSMSTICQHFLPDHKLRYSGYSAWRGVYEYSQDKKPDTVVELTRAYPELGKCLYFDYAEGNHCPLFLMNSNRLNWLWYYNTSELGREGNSMTKKVSPDMIKDMHREADRIWSPELAQLMKETKKPFVNLIYDRDPLPQLVWDNVLLVGDAAHPTTPHASKSTNMSIIDAEALGICLKKWGFENLTMALQEYQSVRLPVVSSIVLRAREVGRLKQGLPLSDGKIFHPNRAGEEECEDLRLDKIHFYEDVPSPK